MYNVRVKRSAETELSAIENPAEKQQVQEVLISLEENPFSLATIKLDPADAFAQVCGRFYITYIVNADDLIVCSIRERPACK